MKLTKLKLKNINSFRKEEEIDFKNPPLGDASLVAITGPTGSGKTTLLDAICVALYNKTPRLGGRGTENLRNLISQGEKECFAEVHFEANGTRYISEWSAQLKGSPSGQLKNADTGERISDRLSSQGKSLGSSENSISEEITSILGLDFAAFKRSIMLAQGEFAAFLKATGDERRGILEATYGIAIYDKLREKLNEKVKVVQAAYKVMEGKVEAIPEVTSQELSDAETELNRLENESEKLGLDEKQIQKDLNQETERKENYNKLQTDVARQKELNENQLLIDNKKIELDQSDLANHLRTEKQLYDTAKTDIEKAIQVLKQAENELSDAKKQIEIHQTEFKSKDEEYSAAEEENNHKINLYTNATFDVKQAETQFDQVRAKTTEMESEKEKIDTLTEQLSERETRQEELQEQISEIEKYLKENPLPADRNQRLTRVTSLQVEINALHKQIQGEVNGQSGYKTQISELEVEIEKLTQKQEKLKSEREEIVESHQEIETKYNTLLNAGTFEEWQSRRNNTRNAQLIAQQYETIYQQYEEEKSGLAELQVKIVEQDASLVEIEEKIRLQIQKYEHAEKEVNRLENERQKAQLANPVNQLRYKLEEGKPCRVCGATHHPYAGEVEHESEELLNDIKNRLDNAVSVTKNAQDQKQDLELQRTRVLQDKLNTSEGIKECQQKITGLTSEIDDFEKQWHELYDSPDISSTWVTEKIEQADKAIDDLNSTQEKVTELSTSLKLTTQKLDTCETDYKRESDLLKQTKQDLENVTSEIEDLKVSISDTEDRFWESMPNDFHGTTPDDAKQQFEDRIKEVDSRERNLATNNKDLEILNTNIENDQQRLERDKTRLSELNNEIQKYQNEGDRLIGVVKGKTEGLETDEAINSAIKNLEEEIKIKKKTRDEADTQLQETRNLLAGKEATHRLSNEQKEQSNFRYEEANKTYHDKLVEVGFTSYEEHEKAFRDDHKIQELTDEIEAHENEIQQLNSQIEELRSIFKDNPYDPEKLNEIEDQVTQIEKEMEEKTKQIGSQGQVIKDLKETLKKREEVSEELDVAKKEYDKWKQLQDTIPGNTLRDFALEIMFQQVSHIANAYLNDLTSERYQLKVETIGKLSVIDRWNANEERPVETLSGGESFLTSLALALSLSELSKGRSQINSLFLDEGFGTLDAETLDVAVSALETLRSQGRSIYLISHIQALTNRLPVKINVRKRGNSSSIEIR